jgi:ABC-type lipoprotein release transport system permease subunit
MAGPDLLPGALPALTTLRLGWRNLARNRRRTWITASTVAIAVLLAQFGMALMVGIERQSFDNLINYQTAHAKLYAAGYFDNRTELPLDRSLDDLATIRRTAAAVPGVAATTPRLTFQAELSNGSEQLPTLAVGIDVAGSDTDVFQLPTAVTAGRYLRAGDEGLLLGSDLTRLFEVGAGDWVTLVTKTRDGAFEAMDLQVVGVIGTGNPLIDRSAFLPIELAQRLLAMPGRATELAVRFDRGAEAATLRRLRDALGPAGGVDVKGWRDVEADFMALVESKRGGMVVMVALFLVLAMVGVTNTVLMAAYERTREIGMLMAMGLRGRGVRTLFLAEGASIGLLGGVTGTAAALGVLALLSGGIDFRALYGDVDIGYPVQGLVYPALQPARLVVVAALMAVVAALASLYPAARASRQQPVVALRHV